MRDARRGRSLGRCGLVVAGLTLGAIASGRAPAPVDAAGHAVRRATPSAGLPPEEAAAAMTVPDGFEVLLLAAEPDVLQPIAMAFDDRGRLWVAEAHAYPRRVPEAEARDRILVFEDTDGDHALDSRKVFCEGLNLVSGLEVGFGGVWVGAAPHLLFIPDADGDDRPDGPPQVLLDGWGWQDTHETLNAFIWGPDGWLYGCHGVFTHSAVGRPGTPDAERVRLNAGVWRYHPVRHAFEVFAHGTSNPWGVDFNDRGHAFATACVIPHLYHVIRGGRYQRQAGRHFDPWTFDDIKTIARHRHWTGGQWNNADRLASDSVGGGHAHSGACIYLGGAWPERYRGRLLMNNIHGARLNQDRLEPAGSGYAGDWDPDFLFANDICSQFVNLRYGPDGQLVLIDWYDANQCHSGDASRHDRTNGRIYKVVFRGAGPVPAGATRVNIAARSDRDLVGLLTHDNEWFARHARRLLQERAAAGRLDPQVGGLLRAGLAAAGPHRLRHLWALHVAGLAAGDELAAWAGDPDPAVRAWALELSGDRTGVPGEELGRGCRRAAADADPAVRLAAASGLQRVPPEHRWEAVGELLRRGEDAADHNLPLMTWYACEPLVPLDPARALALAAGSRIPTVARFIVRRAAGLDEAWEPLVARLAAADSATRRWMLEEVVELAAERGRLPMPAGWQTAYGPLVADPDPEVRRLALVAAVRFGDERPLPQVRATAADRTAATAQRIAAIAALVAVKDPGLPPLLHGLLDDPETSAEALAALAAVPHDETPGRLLEAYAALPPATRPRVVAALISRPEWTLALLDAIDAGAVPRGDLSAFTVGRLAATADPRVLARLNEVWGTIRATPPDRRGEIERWKVELAPQRLAAADLGRGRVVYAKTCGGCHALHGEGGRIGPELTGGNRGDLDYLLENVLDPSAVVGRDYQMTTIVTIDGRSLAGIVVRESPAAVTLQTPTEQVVVPVAEIDQRVLSPASLMPENQFSQLPPRDVRDLVAYLRHPTQVPAAE